MKSILKQSLGLILLVASALAVVAQAPLQYRVDTIDALRSITLYGADAKVTAWVGGKSARDDGLGGMFFYDGDSSIATNVFAIYKPKNNSGRWYKLPTSIANQNVAATAADAATYAWVLLSANATERLSIGANSTAALISSWDSKPLHINPIGNDIVLNASSSGATIVGNTLDVTNTTTLHGYTKLGTSGQNILASYSAVGLVDFGTCNTNETVTANLTVTGAGTNGVVMIGYNSLTNTGLPGGWTLTAGISATNTVTLRAYNGTITNAVDLNPIQIRATVFQY